MFAFPKSGPLIRHLPSSQVEHQALKAFDDAAALHCRCAAAHVLGGDLIHQKLEMQITSIIWAPVVSSGQWWFPWHVLSIVFEKKASNPSPNKCWHGIYMYLCNSNSCVFLQEWWEEIVWNTPHPCVAWVGVLSKYHNGPRPWLCNGMLGALHVQGMFDLGSRQTPQHCLDSMYSLTALSCWRSPGWNSASEEQVECIIVPEMFLLFSDIRWH